MRTWAQATELQRHALAGELANAGCARDRVEAVLESGYYLLTNDLDEWVCDSFLGSDWMISAVPLDTFVRRLNGHSDDLARLRVDRFAVRNLAEAQDALRATMSRHQMRLPTFCYRGQGREYHVQRAVPNPLLADAGGAEALIIPSLYRVHDFQHRPYDPPLSIFHDPGLVETLVYRGLPDVKDIAARNLWTISSLETHQNPDFREFVRRWRLHEVDGRFDKSFPLVEQHYGVRTGGIDVTASLKVALFFALHGFTPRSDGTATYEPCDTAHARPGVVYCFDSGSMRLTQHDVYTKIGIFDHIPPVRPLRQSCAYLLCPPWAFNCMALYVRGILEVRACQEITD